MYHSIVPPPNPPQTGDLILTFVSETQGNKMKIYLLEDISWSENSIVIDEPVVFQMDNSLNPGTPPAELQTGKYTFHQDTGILKFRGEKTNY